MKCSASDATFLELTRRSWQLETDPSFDYPAFNDGVAPGSKIRSILQTNGVKGSFFVVGSNYGSCIYDQADELIARYKAGHLMG